MKLLQLSGTSVTEIARIVNSSRDFVESNENKMLQVVLQIETLTGKRFKARTLKCNEYVLIKLSAVLNYSYVVEIFINV